MTPPLLNDERLNPPLPELDFLLKHLELANQRQCSGHLSFQWGGYLAWKVTFRYGRLAWAWPESNRLRRCQRLAGLPNLGTIAQQRSNDQNSEHNVWDYELLRQMLRRKELATDHVNAIIRRAILEVLFDLVQIFSVTAQHPNVEFQAFKLEQPIRYFSHNPLLAEVKQAWGLWCKAQLQSYSPMMLPIIHQPDKLRPVVSEKSFCNLESLLRGELSLRELAAVMNQPLLPLTQTLASYERRCLIKFLSQSQASAPVNLASEPSAPKQDLQNSKPTPLVLCIDDSELICKHLGQIIHAEGYRYHCSQDPLDGLQQAIQTNPDIIFLDLIMPLISGYDLCAQIRRIPKFRDIPIIILTSNDGIIDRLRTKAVGATHFLSKPVSHDAIKHVLQASDISSAVA